MTYHGYDRAMSRIPTLGPRGEGWLLLQVVFMVAIPVAAWQVSLAPIDESPEIRLGRQVGGLILIGALALIFGSSAFLRGRNAFSALPRPIETGSLVEAGPYRLIRHPIYSGLILAGIAIALIRVSPLVAMLTLALAVVLDLKRRREEAWLTERYPGYGAYRERTKALVPFLY